MNDFTLRPAEEFSVFGSKKLQQNKNSIGITEVSVNHLHHYKNHKYALYTGERFDEMVESIKAYGIFTPLIIRPLNEIDYEILSGHNRYEAAKVAGLSSVPCIIKEVLTDLDANTIVHIANALQRSLDEYSHSERAAIIADYHETMKQQGKRTDLLKAIDEALEGATEPEENQSAKEKFGLSKSAIARYVRLNMLIPEFKEMLDDETLKLRSGVEISYIDSDSQMTLYNTLTNNDFKINQKIAEQLRRIYIENGILAEDSISELFIGKENQGKPLKKISINRNKLISFFPDDAPIENIESTILTALEFYMKHKENIKDMEATTNEQ